MEVSRQLHAPGPLLAVLTAYEAGWVPEPVYMLGRISYNSTQLIQVTINSIPTKYVQKNILNVAGTGLTPLKRNVCPSQQKTVQLSQNFIMNTEFLDTVKKTIIFLEAALFTALRNMFRQLLNDVLDKNKRTAEINIHYEKSTMYHLRWATLFVHGIMTALGLETVQPT
jgi:hypothetical protein